MASMAMVQGPGTNEVMKELTDRSPAIRPASADEPPPAPKSPSKPAITRSGASDAKRAS